VDGPRREYRVVAALTAEEIIIAGRTAWPRYLFLPCEVERKREYLRYGEEHSGMKNFRTEASYLTAALSSSSAARANLAYSSARSSESFLLSQHHVDFLQILSFPGRLHNPTQGLPIGNTIIPLDAQHVVKLVKSWIDVGLLNIRPLF
jgi:hypothetical protein